MYIDRMEQRFRGMVMCHMIADTSDELLEMADRIGVDRRWIQKAGTSREHFDICLSKRRLALAAGAKLIENEVLVQLIKRKREAIRDDKTLATPEE